MHTNYKSTSRARKTKSGTTQLPRLPRVGVEFWDLDDHEKMNTLEGHAEHGAKSALDVFSVKDYTTIRILLKNLIPDFPTRYPTVVTRDPNGKREQLSQIPLTVITNAFAQRTGKPFSDSLLLARLKRLQAPRFPDNPTETSLKSHSMKLIRLIYSTLIAFADPPTINEYKSNVITDWFTSKWPRHLAEGFNKLAKKYDFSLWEIARTIDAYREPSHPTARAHSMISICSILHKIR